MDIISFLWAIIGSTVSGFLLILGWSLTAGRKFQIIDDLKTGFSELQKEIKDLVSRVSKIEGNLFGIARPGSPIKLTPLGTEVLNDSGILNFISSKKELLVGKIKSQNPSTAYDVQEITKNIFNVEGLDLSKEEENKLKDYAFKKGTTLKDVFYAGAIYFRDIALEELGFKTEDLDR